MSLIWLTAPSESLDINFKVSSALVEIVRKITTRPRYILAKVHLFHLLVLLNLLKLFISLEEYIKSCSLS